MYAAPISVSANVVWPALIAEASINSSIMIVVGLIVEFAILGMLYNKSVLTIMKYALSINIVSAVIGLYLRPLAGLVWEMTIGSLLWQMIDLGSFDLKSWICFAILGGLLSAIIELLTLRYLWKEPLCALVISAFVLVNILTTFISIAGLIGNDF